MFLSAPTTLPVVAKLLIIINSVLICVCVCFKQRTLERSRVMSIYLSFLISFLIDLCESIDIIRLRPTFNDLKQILRFNSNLTLMTEKYNPYFKGIYNRFNSIS